MTLPIGLERDGSARQKLAMTARLSCKIGTLGYTERSDWSMNGNGGLQNERKTREKMRFSEFSLNFAKPKQ